MSYAIGGRSGNRGQCAQPCRRVYRLVDRSGNTVVDDRHLLSLRDLNLTEDLPALLDAGVSSFKIEGRLKDKTYVMNVVGHYRQKLDALQEDRGLRAASSGKVIFDFQPNPLKTFNRGFTSYFMHGRKSPVGSPDTPKSLGEPVGRVLKVGRNFFTLDGKIEIHRGDGLCFFDKKNALAGTTVNDVQNTSIFPAKMEGLVVGMPVFRNHDHAFLTALEKSKTERKIGVRFRLAETMAGLALFVQDDDGNEAMQAMQVEKVAAEKPEQALAAIEKQINRLGGTPYECKFVRVDLQIPYFIPLGTLNALRRSALEQLDQQRAENLPRFQRRLQRSDTPYPETELTYFGNVLNRKAEAFYRRHGVTSIEPAAESGLDMHRRKVMTTKHCIKHQMGWCLRYSGKEPVLPRPQDPLSLIDEQGQVYPLLFQCARCEMEIYFGEVE
jgi:putative protease